MNNSWDKNSKLTKAAATICSSAAMYLFFVNGESFVAWTIFYVFLGYAVLLHIIDQQNENK